MKRVGFLVACAVASLVPFQTLAEEIYRVGTWNITNLHHESGVALRDDAVPRADIDYQRLAEFAKGLSLDIIAVQEAGSPAALARIFPQTDYHIVMSADYKSGAEYLPPNQRDIYSAFVLRKARFSEAPKIETFTALGIVNVEIADGKPVDRPVRSGLVLSLPLAGKTIEIMNVHLKSSCNSASLDPVFDTNQDGDLNRQRFDCRTLAAQAMILENWIEQRQTLGIPVMILGDFNRRFARFEGTDRVDHFWAFIEDGGPNGLSLRRAPDAPNTVCWPEPHDHFFPDNIDFILFENALSPNIDIDSIEKIGIPFADHPDYQGKNVEKLSDHCPVVGELRG